MGPSMGCKEALIVALRQKQRPHVTEALSAVLLKVTPEILWASKAQN